MKQTLISLLSCLVIIGMLAGSVTLAWLGDNGMLALIGVDTHVHKSYFESGDGTAARQYQTYAADGTPILGEGITPGKDQGCAFEIKYPIQLYYFAWLQYLGYFNMPDEGSSSTIDQVYFYLSDDLDMTGWVLPPVGTQTYPFVGNFEGNGHTISNLTIQNYSGLTDDPVQDADPSAHITNAEIVGFFGVVGSLLKDNTVNGAKETTGTELLVPDAGYTYDSSINEIKNFNLTGETTITTQTSTSLIGVVAGYVNGTIENVRVGDTATITRSVATSSTSITANLSDYTLLGYVTDAYKDSSDIVIAKIDTPKEASGQFNYASQGGSAGWGGSIGMDEMFNRIDGFVTNRTRDQAVNGEFHYFHNGVEDTTKFRETSYENVDSYEYYNNDLTGRVVFHPTTPRYLFGVREHSVTVTVTNEYHEDIEGFYIQSGNNYLQFNGTTAQTTTNNADKTILYEDETSGYIYYKNGNTKYYLYVDTSDYSLKASTNNQTYRFKLTGNETTGYSMKTSSPIALDRYVNYSSRAFNVNTSGLTVTSEGSGTYSIFYDGSTDYYLQLTGGNATRTRTKNDRTIFSADADGYLYYTNNGTTYYLCVNSNTDTTIRSSTSKQLYMFKISDNKMRVYIREFYVGTGNTLSTTPVTATQITDLVTTETKRETRTFRSNGSYLPLNVYQSNDEIKLDAARLDLLGDDTNVDDSDLILNGAKLNNTGYLIGGTKSLSEYDSAVRVANNYDYSDLKRALGDSNSYNGSNLQILTRTKKSGGVVYISDNYNANTALTNNQKGLLYILNTKNVPKLTPSDLGLESYNNARDNLDKQFKANTSTLYVMRFNEFQISLDHTITAEKVLLNGEIKENYLFPESCFDFQLKQKGFISFFAGGFRGGACNAFFSLYHIVRDDNDAIQSLKKISKIYGSSSKADPYVYLYSDGTYAVYDKETQSYKSTSLPKGYTEHFDMAWVEQPGFTAVDNTCWYFEIPVNEGEYALGAVDGRTGAYIFYLDIATNAQLVERGTVVENFEETTNTYTYPVGATFQDSDLTVTSGATVVPSALATVSTGTESVTVTVSSDTALSYSAGAMNYIKPGVTVNGTLHFKDVTATPASTSTVKIRRTTYYDYNLALDRYTVTVVETRQVGSGAISVTINAWNTKDDWDITSADATQIATMTTGFTPTIQDDTSGVAINTGVSQTMSYEETNGTYYYLIDVSSDANAETLRIDTDAFEGTLSVSKELYRFAYAIKDNDDPDNGGKITYDYDCTITHDSNAADESQKFTFSNRSYAVSVTSNDSVVTDVVTSVTNNLYTVTLSPAP